MLMKQVMTGIPRLILLSLSYRTTGNLLSQEFGPDKDKFIPFTIPASTIARNENSHLTQILQMFNDIVEKQTKL